MKGNKQVNKHDLNVNKLMPGDMIAVDQFEISKPGRTFQALKMNQYTKRFATELSFMILLLKFSKYIFKHLSMQ